MIALVIIFGTATGIFAVTGDNLASLMTAALTTVNTLLLIYGQRHLRREVEPKLQEIHTTAEHVQEIVDRRKMSRPDEAK